MRPRPSRTICVSAQLQLPAAEQLYEQLAQLEGLRVKQTMKARSAGGAERQGRYKKVTARLS